jgi:hypothetical protein
MREIVRFATMGARHALRGGPAYWAWLGALVALVVWGGAAYVDQVREGLIVTNMRDQVSQRTTKIEIKNDAIWKVAELVASHAA